MFFALRRLARSGAAVMTTSSAWVSMRFDQSDQLFGRSTTT